MNNHELERVLRRMLGSVFCGVWASDQLSCLTRSFPLPAYFIVNTHKGDQPGEHWLALTLEEDGSGTFFDSYGFPPDFHYYPRSILRFLEQRVDKIVYHNRQFQHPLSTACGQHCVFYLYHRACGMSFSQTLSLYGKNVMKNDVKASALTKQFQGCTRYRVRSTRVCDHGCCSLGAFLNRG